MSNSITREEYDAWIDYQIGKPCGNHPDHKIKKGQYGNWCGAKNGLGAWCSGTVPTDEFLNNYRLNRENGKAKE